MTVALPGHAPVERCNRAVDGRVIVANLHRLEQQEAAPLGEDAEADARPAGELRNQLAQPSPDGLEPAGRPAIERVVARVHAAGDIYDEEEIVGRLRQRPG